MAAIFRFDALPVDVFHGIAGFLIGCDILALSHVNRCLLTELLAPDCGVWAQRASCNGPPIDTVSAKQRYLQLRTFRFPGLPKDPVGRVVGFSGRNIAEYGGAAPLDFTVQSVVGKSSFSFSMWFALLPGGERVTTGGILLGAQSNSYMNGSGRAINFDAQFIHVDPEANLYCSMAEMKTIVARKLETQRWYHLVLVFEKTNPGDSQGKETVYLDGKYIHSRTKKLHKQRHNTPYWQVGSGYMDDRMADRIGEPREGFYGRYGFYGMIDQFSIWNRTLSSDQIQELHKSQGITGVEPLWSLRKNYPPAVFDGIVNRVGCTRPHERHCVPFAARAASTK